MPEEYLKGLYRSDLLQCLRNPETFWRVIDRRIFDEAHRYGCHVTCDKSRLMLAHSYFLEDYGRVLDQRMPEGTQDLDAFKLGAYVGFWLRRLIPINRLRIHSTSSERLAFYGSEGDYRHVRPEQEFFSLYGNEIAAFRIAYEIVHYCEVSLAAENTSQSIRSILESTSLQPSERTVREIAVTLKHKNNSPHSLYITLLSLFDFLTGDLR